MNNTIKFLYQERQRINDQIKMIQDTCPHNNMNRLAKADTGNWCPDDNRYWYECKCLDCDKFWTEDQ